MKKFILVVVVIVALYLGRGRIGSLDDLVESPTSQTHVLPVDETDVLGVAYAEQKSGIQVSGEGIVTKLLPDDKEGSRHQRFILKLSTGQTLLVAHNIDLAPRLDLLKTGDSVAFNGVYEWSSPGGVIHWTHRDPRGSHPGGWLKLDGLTFE